MSAVNFVRKNIPFRWLSGEFHSMTKRIAADFLLKLQECNLLLSISFLRTEERQKKRCIDQLNVILKHSADYVE